MLVILSMSAHRRRKEGTERNAFFLSLQFVLLPRPLRSGFFLMKKELQHLVAYSDASILPPGAAGAGFIILAPTGSTIDSQGQFLGRGYNDNTLAELEALSLLLYRLEGIQFDACEIFLDSQPALDLLEAHPTGKYAAVLRQIRQALARISGEIDFAFVPRGRNLEANRLAQRAAAKDQWKATQKPSAQAFILRIDRSCLSEFDAIPSHSDKFRYRHRTIPYLFIRSHLDLTKHLGQDIFCLVTARLEKDPRATSRRFQRGWNLQMKPIGDRKAPGIRWQELLKLLK